MLQPGDRVLITLLDQHNNKWRLTDHAKRCVACSLPQANTSGCTQQAANFALLPRLHNVTVVGVSAMNQQTSEMG